MAVAGRSADALLAGTGGILFVTGEAGTGKSRLLAELRQRMEQSPAPDRLPLWLEGRCLSWGEPLAYWPFRELLREWLGASPAHPALRTRVSLRRKVDELFGGEAAEVAAFLGSVLGLPLERDAAERLSMLPPESLRHAAFGAVRSLFERLAEDGPVVVALDDLHWADATSLQLVSHLFPATETAAVLLVLALRPERGHGSWRLREAAQRDLAHRTREITLEALAAGEDARMLDELLGSGTLPFPTAEELLEAAGGNPLFIEELVRSLVDAGALRQGPEGWVFERRLPIEIPRTVESVLASRIDCLPASARTVLGAASVLGRQFDVGVLTDVCEDSTDVKGVLAALQQLQQLQLLEQARRWPAVEFRFHHPLIQEAAYRRLVPDRRRDLHGRAAGAIAARFPDRLAESYGMLALHYERAGEADRAVVHHRLAADVAQRAHALQEAARHCTAALDLTASIPPERARHERPPLHLGRGYAWWQLADSRAGDELRLALDSARAVGDTASELGALEALAPVEGFVEGNPEQSIARLEEALALARRVEDLAAEVSFRNRLTVMFVNRLELDRALQCGEEAFAIARGTKDERLAARAMDGLKLVAFALGDYPMLRRLAGELEGVLRRGDDRFYLQYLLAETSYALAASGDWKGALHRLDEAQEINEASGDRFTLPYLLTLRAGLERARGQYGEAVRLGAAAATAAREGGNTQWVAWSETGLGVILLELGATGEAIEHLETGRLAAEQGGIRIQAVRATSHLALGRWREGDLAAAGRELEAAEQLLDRVSHPPGRHFLYGLDAHLAIAEVRMAKSEVRVVADRISPLLAAARSVGWAEGVARSALMLGECSAVQGRVEDAARVLEEALETAAAGLPSVEWRAHAALAALLADGGDHVGAETHRRLARALVGALADSLADADLCDAFTRTALQRLQ
jgi:tetratricopeptide (TPR) repeat protein